MAPLDARLVVAGGLVLVAIATSEWRVLAGHRALPGFLTVVLVPVVIAAFAGLDLVVGFPRRAWIVVGALTACHMVLSVPAFPYPLYDVRLLDTDVLRLDHLQHLAAGAVVAWLATTVLVEVSPAARRLPMVLVAVGAAAVLGLLKEGTDFLAVTLAHTTEDMFNTVLDVGANIVGAIAVTACIVARRHRAHPAC